MMRPQCRDTADHDRLHGIEPEPEGPLMEQCPKHGPWQATRSIDECPTCWAASEQDYQDRRDAWNDYAVTFDPHPDR